MLRRRRKLVFLLLFFFFYLELIPCSYEGIRGCVFYTHPRIHTVCSLGAWGPIYLHAVEGEGIGVGDKTKREAEKRRKQQGIMEKSQRNKQISRQFPSTDETNLLFRWLRVCVFCLTSVLMVCSIFPEEIFPFSLPNCF